MLKLYFLLDKCFPLRIYSKGINVLVRNGKTYLMFVITINTIGNPHS
jgi:hypothetical protein